MSNDRHQHEQDFHATDRGRVGHAPSWRDPPTVLARGAGRHDGADAAGPDRLSACAGDAHADHCGGRATDRGACGDPTADSSAHANHRSLRRANHRSLRRANHRSLRRAANPNAGTSAHAAAARHTVRGWRPGDQLQGPTR